jgi:hypothetical protein
MESLQNREGGSRRMFSLFGGQEDIWTDSEEDPEEISLTGVSPEFATNIRNIKRQLYGSVVYTPEEGDPKMQDSGILGKYLSQLNQFYHYAKRSKNGKTNQYDVDIFPQDSRTLIETTLSWLESFVQKNREIDRIPYFNYLEMQCITYPFIMK